MPVCISVNVSNSLFHGYVTVCRAEALSQTGDSGCLELELTESIQCATWMRRSSC